MSDSRTHPQIYFFCQYHTFSQYEHSEFTGKIPEFIVTDFPDKEYKFTCCEQWMMFNKAVLFGDTATANMILKIGNPARIRRMGRTVKNFNQKKWDEFKVRIVERGTYLKFLQNPDMLEHLINTPGIIAEAAPWDNVWGIGMSAWNSDSGDMSKWKGENLLGFTLTKVRDRLKLRGDTVDEIIAAYSDLEPSEYGNIPDTLYRAP